MMTKYLDHALYCITGYEIAINDGDSEEAITWESAAEYALEQAKMWEGLDCYSGEFAELVEYHFGDSYRIEQTAQ